VHPRDHQPARRPTKSVLSPPSFPSPIVIERSEIHLDVIDRICHVSSQLLVLLELAQDRKHFIDVKPAVDPGDVANAGYAKGANISTSMACRLEALLLYPPPVFIMKGDGKQRSPHVLRIVRAKELAGCGPVE
jgi:hypothetical protein